MKTAIKVTFFVCLTILLLFVLNQNSKIKQYKESIQILIREIKYLGKAKKKFKEELDLIN